MTLTSFKTHTKLGILVFVLLLYGLSAFMLGLSEKNGYLGKVKNIFSLRNSDKNKSTLAVPINSNPPTSEEQSGLVIGSYVKLCSNGFYSFEVSYPKDWFTTYTSDKEKCTYFAPFAFTVLNDPDANVVPIKIEVSTPENWESTVKFYENPNDFQYILSSQNLEINGKSVLKIKARITSREESKGGFIRTSYLVYNFRLPLVFTYQQTSEKDNVEEFERNLEDMVRSLNYF